MTFSFKKFVELVDQETDPTDEQLDEIFGIFATADEKQKKIQAQKKAEFDQRRKDLQAKSGKIDPTAGAAKNDQRAGNDPRRLPAIQPKPATARQGAAQGRAAELDWVNNMGEAVADEKEFVVTTSNGHNDRDQTVKAKSKEEAKKKAEDKCGYGHYVKGVKLKEARMSVADQVRKDLEEQKKLGVRVSLKALAYPHANEKEMQKYYDNGMSIEEIADLVKQLAGINPLSR